MKTLEYEDVLFTEDGDMPVVVRGKYNPHDPYSDYEFDAYITVNNKAYGLWNNLNEESQNQLIQGYNEYISEVKEVEADYRYEEMKERVLSQE